MYRHVLSLGFILLSAAVAMGEHSGNPSPDWVDRMAAALDRAPAVAADLGAPDWVDRMAGALSHTPVGPATKAASPMHEPEDWISRMIAGRSRELKPRSVLEIEAVKTALIAACGTQNLDGVLALFTRDATVTSGGRTYVGIDQIQKYWAQSGAFHPGSRWVGYSSGETVRVGADADSATLVFECIWLDAGTSRIVARSVARHVLVKSGGTWTITQMSSEAAGGA
jgi:hypothetical protein